MDSCNRRYSWASIRGIVFVIILGIVQIAAGIALEIFSLGAGKLVKTYGAFGKNSVISFFTFQALLWRLDF